ncbi:MAG: AMP-binding protein, partial [Candidatus Nanopelagicales bacterium]
MRLVAYLDKGASLGSDAPCLTTDGASLSYAQVQAFSYRVGRTLAEAGIRPGDTVAILSGNDPVAFSCVFAVSRAAAVWCPINPRNSAAENRDLLDAFDCAALIYHQAFTALVEEIRPGLPKLRLVICLDDWSAAADEPAEAWEAQPVDDIAMIVGTGGTTGRPKGVLLTGHNLETMSALTLIGYPFQGRPTYLALAPLTHAAGVLCFPVMTLGGEIVVMRAPDLSDFLALVGKHRVTHTFLPPTLIYMLLARPELDATDMSSLQCFWYGAAPMSVERLEEALHRIGPVMGQFFGQTEAPMMVSMLPPAEHFEA